MTETQSAQRELPLCPPRRRPIPLDIPTIQGKPNYEKALEYVITCGNFENEKELYMQLGINSGNWTKVKQGKYALPWRTEKRLEELCGNNGLTIWRAFQWGCELRELKSTQEKRIADLEAAIAERDKHIAIITEFAARINK
jgi:hypothetical protein